jgi:hypothetical protein
VGTACKLVGYCEHLLRSLESPFGAAVDLRTPEFGGSHIRPLACEPRTVVSGLALELKCRLESFSGSGSENFRVIGVSRRCPISV